MLAFSSNTPEVVAAFRAGVRKCIEAYAMLPPGALVIVAVSGGADSMALLTILSDLQAVYNLRLCVAHVNHQLRGAEADRDEDFVRQQAARLALPFHPARVDVKTFQRQARLSPQHAARQLRYRFFLTLQQTLGASCVALGHTADDQAETLLVRLLRGTGPGGLAGMPAVRLPYIRPLITSRHQEVLTYLQARQLPWREDSSNTHRAYVRNRVRLDLVPILQQYNPRIVNRLNDLVAMLRTDNDYLEQQTDAWMTQIIHWHAPTRVTIHCNAFQRVHLSLQRRLLRRIVDTLAPLGVLVRFGHVEALRQLLTTGRTGQRCVLPGQLQAERYADTVRLWYRPALSPQVEVQDLPVPGTVQLPTLQLQLQANVVERNAVVLQPDPQQAYLDWQRLGSPLWIRFWRPGDRFHPLGAPGTKKLQDFFVDTKIPKAERATIPLVVMAETIVWVVGYRIAEPFKVHLETRSVLHLQCESVAVTE